MAFMETERLLASVEKAWPFPAGKYKYQPPNTVADHDGHQAFALTHVLKRLAKSLYLLRRIHRGKDAASLEETHELVRKLIFGAVRFAQLAGVPHLVEEHLLQDTWKPEWGTPETARMNYLLIFQADGVKENLDALADSFLYAESLLEEVDHDGVLFDLMGLAKPARQFLWRARAMASQTSYRRESFEAWLEEAALAPA